MEGGSKVKPTIKVQREPDCGEGRSRPSSAVSIVGGFHGQNKNKRTDHLGVFRSASPVTTGSNANDNNLFLALPTSARSHGGRSLSAASLYNENGVPCPLSDEKLLIK